MHNVVVMALRLQTCPCMSIAVASCQGDVAGGNCLFPKFWTVRKLSENFVFVQKSKIWGWNPHFGDILGHY